MITTMEKRQSVNIKFLLKSNLKLIVITVIFVFSLVIGSFSVSVGENSNMASYFLDYIKYLKNCEFLNLFFNYYFYFSLFILLNMVLGLCVIGVFLNWFVLFLLGFGIGNVSGFIFYEYSLNGLCFFLLLLMPALFLYSIVFIISFRDSSDFSLKLLRSVNKREVFSESLKKYFIKYIIYFIILIFISLFNTFVITNFYVLFDF